MRLLDQVPPQGKGALYIRPLLIGSGPILGLAPAPEYTFLVYASPVGNYFKEGVAPINLVVGDGVHRAMPGGTGGVKTISNYGPVRTSSDATAGDLLLHLQCRCMYITGNGGEPCSST